MSIEIIMKDKTRRKRRKQTSEGQEESDGIGLPERHVQPTYSWETDA